MSPVVGTVKPELVDPSTKDSCVLSCAQVSGIVDSTGDPPYGSTDLGPLFEVEERLEQAIAAAGVGERPPELGSKWG